MGLLYICQYPISYYSIDFFLPMLGVGLEVDGVYWHSSARQIASDRRKEQRLQKAGIQTVRITDREIHAASDLPSLIALKLHLNPRRKK